MFTMTDVENLILGMAELVRENRYLRKENERLSEELAVAEVGLIKCMKLTSSLLLIYFMECLLCPIKMTLIWKRHSIMLIK